LSTICTAFFEKLQDGEGAEIISPYYTITSTLPNWVELAQKRAILQNADVKLGEAEFRFYYQRCDQVNLVEDVAHTRIFELTAVPSYYAQPCELLNPRPIHTRLKKKIHN